MAKITRRQLKQIIQEEIQNTVIDEGFVDTFKMLGGDLKKWYKSAEQRGDVVASERAGDKVIQATIQTLEGNLNKLRSKYGMEGEKGTEAIQQRMAELAVQIKALKGGGEKAEDVVDAIADASDGEVEVEFPIVKYLKDLKNLPEKEREEAAAPEVAEKAKEATLSVPDDVLELVISYLAQSNKYKGKSAIELRALMDKPGVLKGMARGVQRQAKKAQVAEGKTTITRQALKEVLSLLTENGL